MEATLITRTEDVPFVRESGIAIVARGLGWAIAGVDQRPALTSHFGTFQGAALYALAETAMSAVLEGLLAQELTTSILTLSDATISFSRPASGRATAHATLSESPERILGRFARDCATALAVVVRLRDGAGNEVGSAEFSCRISKRLAATAA
jgi:acyl-coenzyme A thioesterase PaaI-like protein